MDRPKLGVQVKDATPDLNGQFKNPAQDGAVLMEVMPGSVADQAGLKVGDCVISFDQVPVRSAQELVQNVRGASDGKHKLVVLREGAEMAFHIQLKAKDEAPKDPGRAGRERLKDPWIKKKGHEEVVEIHASALKMDEALAKALNLDEKRKKQMEEVLVKHATALNKEYAERSAGPARRSAPLNHDTLEGMVRRQVEEAEGELKGILTENQIQTWREYRGRNREISISRRLKIEETNRDESQGF
jgi:C-terminal processing protease CtpA/Prc